MFCWIQLTLPLILSISVMGYQQDNIFKVFRNPRIPDEFSSFEMSKMEVMSMQHCAMLCNREEQCEAAIISNGSTCTLYEGSVINMTDADGGRHQDVYLETFCANNAANRPSYCAPAVPEPYPEPLLVYKDCQEYYENGYSTDGTYQLNISGSDLDLFDAWCEFFDNHGWTVIQKRFNGSVDFNRTWVEYKNGFGETEGEHWLGNDKIHALTETNRKLNIYLEAADGTFRSGTWVEFQVASEEENYRLTVTANGYSGDADESFSATHNGMNFTTTDVDNDALDSYNCGNKYSSGWWFKQCFRVNLNGQYEESGVSSSGYGINWCCDWKDHIDSLVKTTMRLTRD